MDGETNGSPGKFSLSNGTHKEEEGRSLMSQNGNDEEDIASNKNGGETSEAKSSTSEPLQARSYETKPDAVLASDGKEDEKKAKNKTKRDRSKLRKGKWTVEEEEFTSRIIQHFSTGVLTLPEGATLRSFLADKLNCDPMRITKKFTGACCLGRRVYHLRDRPRATQAEIDMAKAELDLLENRFRIRIEHEQAGLPLPPRQEMLLAQSHNGVGTLYPMQNRSATNVSQPWLSTFPSAGIPTNSSSPSTLPGNRSMQVTPSPYPVARNTPYGASGQWLLPSHTDPSQNDQSLQVFNNMVVSWAFAQAAASLSPALSQLAFPKVGFNPSNGTLQLPQHKKEAQKKQGTDIEQRKQQNEEHQRQLRSAYEERKKEEERKEFPVAYEKMPKDKDVTNGSMKGQHFSSEETLSPAEQLQKSYKAHLESLKGEAATISDDTKAIEQDKSSNSKADTSLHEREAISSKTQSTPLRRRDEVSKKTGRSLKGKSKEVQIGDNRQEPEVTNKQVTADEEDGTILLGFLKSLRQSYEDAVEDRQVLPAKNKLAGGKSERREPVKPIPSNSNASKELEKTKSNTRTQSSKGLSNISNSTKRNGKRPLDDRLRNEQCQQDNIQITSAHRFQTTAASTHRTLRPASVTDTSTLSRSETSSGTSSQPAEDSSSLEDSDSKSDKTDPSSSEESEKDCTLNKVRKGPPRKRLKASEAVKEFTTQNLMEHSKRMNEEFQGSVEKGKY